MNAPQAAPADALARLHARIRMWSARSGEHPHPPASEETLAAFETRHDLMLPQSYRCALAAIGDGGWQLPIGTSWRLTPLARAHIVNPWRPAEMGDGAADLARPFPLTESYAHGAHGEEEMDDDAFDAFHQSLSCGLLYLGHGGCTMHYLLVVRGPAHGSVWLDDRGADNGMTRVADDFLDWCLT